MLWYNELAVSVAKQIESMPWEAVLPGRELEVTSRPKTIDTLTQKLQRERPLQLPSIQDIAGVRVDVEMNLDEQDKVVTAITSEFEDQVIGVRDMRAQPHSGYRAVHIWLKADARVEIQIRTHLQSEWANMYERAADLWGREIRYSKLPESAANRQTVEQLQALSTDRVAELENLARDFDSIKVAFARAAKVEPTATQIELEMRLKANESKFRNIERELRRQIAIVRGFFDAALVASKGE